MVQRARGNLCDGERSAGERVQRPSQWERLEKDEETKEITKNRSEVDDSENESISIENMNGSHINMSNDNEGSGIVLNEAVPPPPEYFDEFSIDLMKSSNHEINAAKTDENTLAEMLEQDIEAGTKNLVQLSGASDGLQLTADSLINTRHFANTLFNIMRGGIFDHDYFIEKDDFLTYISKANKDVFESKMKSLENLPNRFTFSHIQDIALKDTDKDFKRLCLEYLPLKFSRRHGDPSRPWNKFSINTRSEIDGSKILDYEGNWRDIFQNWEALAHSYPEFIESMIHKFLNATTFEGYNPYRVTKDGFDWEVIEEDDPWSYIGYWGDHQIIYLLKFLEFIEDHYPNRLASLFTQDIFVYANVPYKIKSYQDTLKNPKDTIDNDIFMLPHLIITETNVNGELLEPDTEFVVTVVQYQPGVDGSIQQGDI